jgi:hypothetical protein
MIVFKTDVPIQVRRRFGTFTNSITNLSETEKAQLGITSSSSRSVFENPRREPTMRETLEAEGEKGQPR